MTTTKQSTFGATLRTTILLATLSGLLVAIGFLIGGASTALLFLVMAALMNMGSYFFSDKLALAMSGAKPVTEAEAPKLYEIVRELTDARRPADAAPLRRPRRPAQRLRHRPQPAARGGRRRPAASSASSPTKSCAASSPTSSPTSSTATS